MSELDLTGPAGGRQALRARAVEEALARIRTLLDGDQPPADALAAAEAVVRALAARAALWPQADFPIPDGALWQAHRLHQDDDGRYAMYAVAMRPGHAQPPHDHTTWALIAGVRGTERNVRYARPRPGAAPAPLTVVADTVVTAGRSLALGPHDIHAIEVLEPDHALHLHVYGRGFAYLDERRIFDLSTGAARPFPPITGLS